MVSVFIVRLFGKKSVTVKDKDGKDTSIEVDFDQIDQSLEFVQKFQDKLSSRLNTTLSVYRDDNLNSSPGIKYYYWHTSSVFIVF